MRRPGGWVLLRTVGLALVCGLEALLPTAAESADAEVVACLYATPARLDRMGHARDLSWAELFAFDRTDVMIEVFKAMGPELTCVMMEQVGEVLDAPAEGLA